MLFRSDNISVQCIYDEVVASGHTSVKMLAKKDILDYLSTQRATGGVVAFLGAGDIGEIADEFANRFKKLTA